MHINLKNMHKHVFDGIAPHTGTCQGKMQMYKKNYYTHKHQDKEKY